MKDIIKSVVVALVAGIVSGCIVLHFVPKSQTVQNFGSSTVGTTFTVQKQLSVIMSLANGTTTSVVNSNAYDEYLTSFNYACTGVGTSQTAYSGAGLANLTVKAATTTTNLSASTPTSNTAANANLSLTTSNISTSTATTVVASSSIQDITTSFMIVPAGSYLTFITNATNTATCTFAAEVIGS